MSSIASDDMSPRLAVHSHNAWPSISREGWRCLMIKSQRPDETRLIARLLYPGGMAHRLLPLQSIGHGRGAMDTRRKERCRDYCNPIAAGAKGRLRWRSCDSVWRVSSSVRVCLLPPWWE